MKRITALLLAMALMLGSVGTAEADGIDVKVKGQWDFNFEVTGNRGWYTNVNRSSGVHRGPGNNSGRKADRRDDDRFYARHRIRTQVNFITSEYLQAVLHFEIGDFDWGQDKSRVDGGKVGPGAGGDLDSDGVNIETKHAYLDWLIPDTDVSVRMGIQRMALPSTRLNNPILDADVAGIVVSSPITDWIGVTALWARPWNRWNNDNSSNWAKNGRQLHDDTDAFGVILPMTFSDWGTSISPYFIYALVGGSSGHAEYMFADDLGDNTANNKAKAWWAGTNITVDILDPLVGSLDVAYGHLNSSEYNFGTANDQRINAGGWFIAGTLDYKMDWMTPGIFGWWGSGDRYKDLRNGRLGRMPFLSNDGGNFSPTSFGTNGFYGIGNGGNDNLVTGTGLGTWGVGIQVADVTFIEDLSHTLRFAYYQGTNSKKAVEDGLVARQSGTRMNALTYSSDNLYMTTADKAFEINFDHQYKIYENLTAVLELGYIHLKSDNDVWQSSSNLKDNSNAYKVGLNFRYQF